MEEEDDKRKDEEEQPPTRLTDHSSPCPDVAWELHSSESHGQPDVTETQYKTQLTDSQDEASIKGNNTREGDPDLTVDLEQVRVEHGQLKDDRIQSLREMQKNGSYLDDGSLTEETGAEELATRALTEGDRERMDKTFIKGKTTEGEHDTMSHGDKTELEKEDCDIHLRLKQEEEEEKKLQKNAAMEFLASEEEEKPTVSVQQVRNQLFVIEQSAGAKLHHKNGNLPEAQVVTFGKPEKAANLTDMQSNNNQKEKSGVMSNGSPAELTPIHCSANERCILDVQAEQEQHSCKLDNEECYRQTSQTNTSVTVNSPNNVNKVVPQWLNPPTFEEVQRGFPECNNEQRQDDNTIERVLEKQDFEECQTLFLPEEMEAKQNVQNNCSTTGFDKLLLTECVVEEQKNKGNIQEGSDLTSGAHCGLLHFTDAASLQKKEAPFVESGKQEILFGAVRTGTKHLEEEPGGTLKALGGGRKELLAEIEKNYACEVHACKGDQETQQVVMFSDETVKQFEDKKQEMAETSCKSSICLEDFSESELMRQEVGIEPTCLEDTGDMQDVGFNLEKFGSKDDNIVLKDKSKSKSEKDILNLSVASLSESNTNSGNNPVGESESQQSKAMSNDTISKSTAKDLTVKLAEETKKHVTMIHTEESRLNSAQEVIDEETIDLWIQRVLSQETDGVSWQKEPEPGQQMGRKIERLNSEGDKISSDLTESEDQFVKVSQSGRAEFRSDTGMSSGTEQATSGDGAHYESGSPNGGNQLWTLNIPGSLLSTTFNILESDVSEIVIPGPTPESLDILMEDILEIQQSRRREAGHQELGESQGNFPKESASQSDVEMTDHTEQTEKQILKADIQSSAEMNPFILVTKVNKDILKDTGERHNSGDEVLDVGSGPFGSSFEVSLEEENISADYTSQGDPESSMLLKPSLMGTPQVLLSEDYIDSLPRLNRTQVTTHLTKGFGNQMEVLLHILFLSEKSL